jgi:hypothetical protein
MVALCAALCDRPGTMAVRLAESFRVGTLLMLPRYRRGTASEIERQLTEHVSILRQQVSILTDVTQALLQIVAEDHEQRSTRTKRAFRWIRETWKRFWLAIEQNMAYRITAVIGTLVGTVAALWGLIRYFHLFDR